MKKRVVAFIESALLPNLTQNAVKKLNSKCISVVAFHEPDVLVLDIACPADVVGKEIDSWAEKQSS